MSRIGKRFVKLRDRRPLRPSPESLENRCLLASGPFNITVSGVAKWTDSGGGKHDIPLADVEIRSTAEKATDPPLATTQTMLDGTFTATVSFPTSGGSVFAQIFARNPAANVKPETGAGATTYSMVTANKAVTADGAVDLGEKDGSNSVVDEESFSILGATLQANTYAATLGGGSVAPSQLDVRFPSNTAVHGTASFFLSSTKQLFITQRRVFDWDVIEHEYGHYFADRAGFFAPIGGDHNFQTVNPKPDGVGRAWNEGWADFFSISAQINDPSVYANGVPNEGDTAYNPAGPPAGTNPFYDLKAGTGVGELDEAAIASALYHLTVGDQGITVTDTTLFQDLVTAKAGTFGAAYDAIAATMTGPQRSLLGHILGLQQIAPYDVASTTPGGTATGIPTITWKDADPSNGDDFIIQFFTSDYSKVLFTTKDLGDTFTYTPTADEWFKISNGHTTIRYFVEAKDTTAPETPGSVPDQVFASISPDNTNLDRYWSESEKVNGPKIAIVLDVTGSMSPEIASVQAALVQYIQNLQMSLAPDESPPTIDLVTFRDAPMETISSDDLSAVESAIEAQDAEGGGDIPEPSAQALEFAAQDIDPGGTLLIITDAPSDAGTDLDATIAQLRAQGDTVNADISGDYGYDDAPTGDSVSSALLLASRSSVASGPTTGSGTLSAKAAISSTGIVRATSSSISADDGPEPPQGPVSDPGQTPVDDAGNTTATAAPLTVDGSKAHGFIGNTVQTSTGGTSTDSSDYYSFNLVAGTSYNIPVLTDGSGSVRATLYGTDGKTSVASGSTIVGDPGFGYLTLTYVPKVAGTYYLDVSNPDSPTGYTVQVSDNPLVGATSSVVLWTTVAEDTGGEFLFKPAIVNNSGNPAVATDYQASIVNVMDSTFEPTVLSASPNSVPAGSTLDVTLTGSKTDWIQGNSSVAFSAPGLTVGKVTVNSPTSITVTMTAASSAALNFSNVSVTTKLGSATETAVGSNALHITAAPTTPTLLEVQPGVLARGGTYAVRITGTLTSWDATSTLSLGPGVTVSGVTVVSPTEITANAVIGAAASIGFRAATVTTADKAGTDTQVMAITLTAAPVTAIATVASITPNQAEDGQHAVIAVVGENTNFVDGKTTADFGPGVTVDSVSVSDATHATVTIDVGSSAAIGFRNVTLTTGTETATTLDGFQVEPLTPSSPVVTTNPVNASVPANQTVIFTAAATGNPAPTVQWQSSTDNGKTFTIIVGATSTTYSFVATADQTGDEYQAVFTNSQGAATTTAATLTVASPTIATRLTLSKSVPGPTAGGSVTFTANIAVTSGELPQSGTVDFVDKTTGKELGAEPVSNGQAVLSTSSLTAGAHVIVASFGGVAGYSTSQNLLTLNVQKDGTKTQLAVAPASTTVGKPVTLTAIVTANPVGNAAALAAGKAIRAAQSTSAALALIGTVTFRDGHTVLGTVRVNADGVARVATTLLAAGRHTITATYSGDPNYLGSPSNAATVTVTALDGPRVTLVQRFGYHAMPTTLVVTFNAPLDVTSAQDPSNYLITGPAGAIPVGLAIYNPISHAVTLYPVTRLNLHKRYTLTVVGTGASGVKGTAGNLLDGENTGRAGSNFVVTVDASLLVVLNPFAPGAAAALRLASEVRAIDARAHR